MATKRRGNTRGEPYGVTEMGDHLFYARMVLGGAQTYAEPAVKRGTVLQLENGSGQGNSRNALEGLAKVFKRSYEHTVDYIEGRFGTPSLATAEAFLAGAEPAVSEKLVLPALYKAALWILHDRHKRDFTTWAEAHFEQKRAAHNAVGMTDELLADQIYELAQGTKSVPNRADQTLGDAVTGKAALAKKGRK